MQRLGQPAVIGHLMAGILLGPSFFGLIWPEAQRTLFSQGGAQRAMLDGIAQFGVLLLLLLTGMDTDVGLIRKVGRPAIAISLMGIVIPFACGVSLAFFLPDTLIPHVEERLATALFLGVALSISSIKIVAMVVHEMNFMRRDLGRSSSPPPSSMIRSVGSSSPAFLALRTEVRSKSVRSCKASPALQLSYF